MMILELDSGNSRIKWRYLPAAGEPAALEGHAADIPALVAALRTGTRPDWIRACSVRGQARDGELAEAIHALWGLGVNFAAVTRSCGGVSNEYEDLTRLGIDRWLAMLAAYGRTQGPCIVVDSGTALTVDVLDAAGVHQGGYIVPGLGLMRAALEQTTAIRLQGGAGDGTTALGHSTVDAVGNGCLAAAVALIARVVARSAASAPRLYFAGGDAILLRDNLRESGDLPENSRIEIVPHLVLDGLAVALPEPGAA